MELPTKAEFSKQALEASPVSEALEEGSSEEAEEGSGLGVAVAAAVGEGEGEAVSSEESGADWQAESITQRRAANNRDFTMGRCMGMTTFLFEFGYNFHRP